MSNDLVGMSTGGGGVGVSVGVGGSDGGHHHRADFGDGDSRHHVHRRQHQHQRQVPRMQKQFDWIQVEYQVLRRFQHPILDSIKRLTKVPDVIPIGEVGTAGEVTTRNQRNISKVGGGGGGGVGDGISGSGSSVATTIINGNRTRGSHHPRRRSEHDTDAKNPDGWTLPLISGNAVTAARASEAAVTGAEGEEEVPMSTSPSAITQGINGRLRRTSIIDQTGEGKRKIRRKRRRGKGGDGDEDSHGNRRTSTVSFDPSVLHHHHHHLDDVGADGDGNGDEGGENDDESEDESEDDDEEKEIELIKRRMWDRLDLGLLLSSFPSSSSFSSSHHHHPRSRTRSQSRPSTLSNSSGSSSSSSPSPVSEGNKQQRSHRRE